MAWHFIGMYFENLDIRFNVDVDLIILFSIGIFRGVDEVNEAKQSKAK